MQARILRAAAQNGGSIDRQTVHLLAEYPPEQNLTGFTKPVGGLCGNSRRKGSRQGRRDAALLPDYRGKTKVQAFSLPPDLTEHLRLMPPA